MTRRFTILRASISGRYYYALTADEMTLLDIANAAGLCHAFAYIFITYYDISAALSSRLIIRR